MMKICKWILLLTSTLLLTNMAVANSGVPNKARTISPGLAMSGSLDGTYTFINVNGIASYFDWQGISAFDPSTASSGTLFPRGQVGTIYRDGLVWGGLSRDGQSPAKRVGGNTYIVGTQPGIILPNGEAEDYESLGGNDGLVRIYRIRSDWQSLPIEEYKLDAAEIFRLTDTSMVTSAQIEMLRAQYELDWRDWPTERGAPYYDVNDNGEYDPVRGDHGPLLPVFDLQSGALLEGGDYPGYADGDQVIWFVTNDLDSERTDGLNGSPPLGLEIQHTIWAYKNDPDLQSSFFRYYKIHNRSGADIDDFYVSQWSDPDVGSYSDDYVGCDSVLSLMFAYNGNSWDAEYEALGMEPAAIGYTFLAGPARPAAGDSAIIGNEFVRDYQNLPMTSFAYFTAGGVPAVDPYFLPLDSWTRQWYNLMRGFLPTDTDEPVASYQHYPSGDTKFPLNGDPRLSISATNDVDGWIMGPADRRMVMSSGPIDLKAGASTEIWLAVIGGQRNDHLDAVVQLKERTQYAQYRFRSWFGNQPIEPEILLSGEAQYDDTSFRLQWTDVAQDYDHPGYGFIGYDLYQINPSDGRMIKIANYDVIDGMDLIVDGDKRYEGLENGTQVTAIVSADAFSETPFRTAHVYQFAIVAYVYNSTAPAGQQLMSSGLRQLNLRLLPADYNKLLSVTHSKGASTAEVSVEVYDPALMRDNQFSLHFNYDAEADKTYFSLINASQSETIRENIEITQWTSVFDIAELGLRLRFVDREGAADWSSAGERWISAVNWGGQIFFGGISAGENFLGSRIRASDVYNVRIDFQDQAAVLADGYASQGAYFDRGNKYSYVGIGSLPFAAYDIRDPENPRRLNISFVEDDHDGLLPIDGIWDMGWNADSSGWESDDPAIENIIKAGAWQYAFILNSDYDAGASYNQDTDIFNQDVVYGLWAKHHDDRPFLDTEFSLTIYARVPLGSGEGDVYEFQAEYTDIDDDAELPQAFGLGSTYPNPFNPSTTIAFSLAQSGLTKVTIYNLLGQQVETLQENVLPAGQHQVQWDASAHASGLYFVHLQQNGRHDVRKMMLIK
jgi:hypothetical protein